MNKIYTSPVGCLVEFETYRQLETYLNDVRYQGGINTVVTQAVREWLENVRSRAAEAPRTTVRGYLWKDVFLPEGSRLRTTVAGQAWYAVVEGDRLLHNGDATSPHRFANAFGQAGRNAWKTVHVLLPYQTHWRLAAHLRQAQRRF